MGLHIGYDWEMAGYHSWEIVLKYEMRLLLYSGAVLSFFLWGMARCVFSPPDTRSGYFGSSFAWLHSMTVD